MPNYTFLDATGTSQTAGSSVIGGVNYPQVFVQGSVVTTATTTQSGTVITSVSGIVNVNSIIGTVASNSQHSLTDVGMVTLGLRNDTLTSVTGVTNAYSPMTIGAVGEVMTANAPITQWVQGNASALSTTTQGALVPIIAAQGASIFSYITSLQISNFTASSVLTTLFGATSSIVAYATIPGNQTIALNFTNALKTNANAAFSASILSSPVPSVYLSAQGFISKT